jgi:hypothetical protein
LPLTPSVVDCVKQLLKDISHIEEGDNMTSLTCPVSTAAVELDTLENEIGINGKPWRQSLEWTDI